MPKKYESVATKKKSRKQGPRKGALISGMTKRLPSGILSNPAFKKAIRTMLRGHAGIYVLYNGERIYYVGLTKNLFGRIRWHLKDRHAGNWDKFVVFRMKHDKYLKDIETLVLILVRAPGNIARGKLPKVADLNRELLRIVREQNKEMLEIEEALS